MKLHLRRKTDPRPMPEGNRTMTEERLHRALAELLAEAGELHRDAEDDLASAEAMPPGRTRDVAVRIARSNVDAHADRVEVLRMARKLFEPAPRQGRDIASESRGTPRFFGAPQDAHSGG
jgi:hypothetical protein